MSRRPNPIQNPRPLTMNDGHSGYDTAQWNSAAKRSRPCSTRMSTASIPRTFRSNVEMDSVETMRSGRAAIVKHNYRPCRYSPGRRSLSIFMPTWSRQPVRKAPKVPVIIGGGSIRRAPNFPRPIPLQARLCTCSHPRRTRLIRQLLLETAGFRRRNSARCRRQCAGLDRGHHRLTNKGQPRKLDDWGVLRAWAWGDSRILDYLETDPDVDVKHVGVRAIARRQGAWWPR